MKRDLRGKRFGTFDNVKRLVYYKTYYKAVKRELNRRKIYALHVHPLVLYTS